MHVGPGETKGTHPGHPRLRPARPVHGLMRQLEVHGRPVDTGVGPLQMGLRGNPAVLHHQAGLDQRSDARCRLEVPDIGLDRGHRQRRTVGAGLAIGVVQGVELDGITQHRAGAMGLHVADLPRMHAGVGQCFADQRLLRRTIGHCQPGTGTVVIDRRTENRRDNRVTLPLGLGLALENDHAAALPSTVTVALSSRTC